MGGLRKKLAELPALAARAPKLSRMTVTPYSQLPAWPGTETPQELLDEYIQLASYWGSYTTLYDEVQYILEHPQEFLLGRVHSYQSMLVLQDHIQNGIEGLERLAVECSL